MAIPSVKKMIYPFLLIWLTFFTVSGCGKGSGAQEGELLRISVQIPEGESSDLFWYGVESKVLQVKRGDELISLNWESGRQSEVEVAVGDGLTFFGYDRDGRVLVTGEGRVGESKFVLVPLRRVL